jgi:hypothetical protein
MKPGDMVRTIRDNTLGILIKKNAINAQTFNQWNVLIERKLYNLFDWQLKMVQISEYNKCKLDNKMI